jgi:hypothetical protein
MIKIHSHYYGSDIKIDYDPSKYKTKAGASKGLYKALQKYADKMGWQGGGLFIQTPEQSYESNGCKSWRVGWEGWEYDWAIGASFQIHGKWGYTEPYYGFDLNFVD